MPQFDFAHVFWPQVAWLAVFFAVLYFGVVRLTLPKLGKVMGEREDKISGDLSAAKVAKDAADEVDARYHADMNASREDARKAIADAKAKAAKASEKSLAKATASAEAELAEAEARIAAAVDAAQGALRDAAAESAQAIVAKLTGGEPTLDAAKASVAAHF
ncbi:MAG: ATPase [Novosphingobium sp.]|uniref:F0F1 ATP synthase subunit B family protein n=1 Tax=Novosphingobium sp. TaxID=1874826 RepID=UPI0026266696|nr:ATPase [Novosphingobium sp.]MCP5386589.1 ATPase [Novosphingobium sp.]